MGFDIPDSLLKELTRRNCLRNRQGNPVKKLRLEIELLCEKNNYGSYDEVL